MINISYKSDGDRKNIAINTSYIVSVNIEKWYQGEGFAGPYCQGGIITIIYNNKNNKDILYIDRYDKAESIYNSIIENLK